MGGGCEVWIFINKRKKEGGRWGKAVDATWFEEQ